MSQKQKNSDTAIQECPLKTVFCNIELYDRAAMKAPEVREQIFIRDFDVSISIAGGNDYVYHQQKKPHPRTATATPVKLKSCRSYFCNTIM